MLGALDTFARRHLGSGEDDIGRMLAVLGAGSVDELIDQVVRDQMVADVDVGENIGAKLQTDQAEADLKIAQAKAEERRAMAKAREQEMTAQVIEMESRVKEAEAEIPKAMAEAFRAGNLGIMDYYRMRNIQADTEMRDSISENADEEDN